jgi:hypothetical protein
MAKNLDRYDTSNFEKTHPLYSAKNARVLGKFKSETGSQAPCEFCGLRSKMYSLLITANEKPKMTAKGIKKSYVTKHVRHDQYKAVLMNKDRTYAKFRNFRSTNHVMHTLEIHKTCLNAWDDKRYILDDGVTTLAYGHKRLR